MQKPERSEEEKPENQQTASPEEQQQAESDAGEGQGGAVPADTSAPRERRRKKAPQLTETELSRRSHSSIWPILLALSIVVLIAGAIIHPIGLGVGLVLVIVSIIGWSVERR